MSNRTQEILRSENLWCCEVRTLRMILDLENP
jgi:hypothetical protein